MCHFITTCRFYCESLIWITRFPSLTDSLPCRRADVHTHVFQLGNYVSCMLNIANSRAFPCRLLPPPITIRASREISRRTCILREVSRSSCTNRRSAMRAGCELRYNGEIQPQPSAYYIPETSHVANAKPVCLKWYITKPKKSRVCINLPARDNLVSDLQKLVTLIE